MRKGIYYKLEVYDVNNVPLSPQSLEKQLQWIMEDADKHEGNTPDTICIYHNILSPYTTLTNMKVMPQIQSVYTTT